MTFYRDTQQLRDCPEVPTTFWSFEPDRLRQLTIRIHPTTINLHCPSRKQGQQAFKPSTCQRQSIISWCKFNPQFNIKFSFKPLQTMSLESLKKSRSIHIGIITKGKNKYSAMESQDPSTFNLRKLKEAIRKEESKHDELKQTQSHIMEYSEDINEDDEQTVIAHFEENVESTIDIIQSLMELNRIHVAVHHLQEDLDALSKLQEEQPEREHSATANRQSVVRVTANYVGRIIP